MPYSDWLQAYNYSKKMNAIIGLNILLCKILLVKYCMGGVVIYGYSIPEPSMWEFTWAIIILIWNSFGKFAMYWSRNVLKVYIYTNSCVTVSPLLTAGIKYYSEIRTMWNALLKYNLQNLPIMLFWYLFSVVFVAAQVVVLHRGYNLLQLTQRQF